MGDKFDVHQSDTWIFSYLELFDIVCVCFFFLNMILCILNIKLNVNKN